MTRVLLLAALALACVVLFVLHQRRADRRAWDDWRLYLHHPRAWFACVAAGGLAIALPSAGPALAAEVATIGDKAVILPWGDWLVAFAVSLREPILTILLPIVAAYIIQAIRKVYPMAALFLTQRRVEMMLEAGVGYGLNAVQGAAKGKTLSVNVAVPVIAKGTQYLVDTAPPAVIRAAGGADGVAARIFRKLDLDDAASEANVLVPAVERIEAGVVSAEELRDADRMSRG
ncbi:hypothetical protein [Methylobacterium sp. B4]|uniref:hypothetical protein n=1 Tax=Methylobacterium sp. B4 TaxID=1938755 RepID=UPI000D86B87C|nr:hypothetical protein [Methylobacterium sp. B4]PXW65538.1 hypothetical protein BY998_103351 [Methylobacterium sp. B4]